MLCFVIYGTSPSALLFFHRDIYTARYHTIALISCTLLTYASNLIRRNT